MNRLALLVMMLVPSVAAADPDPPQPKHFYSSSGYGFFLALEGSTVLTGSQSAPVHDLTLVTARASFSAGAARVRYYYGFDVGFGASISGAAGLFDVQLLLLGIGFELGTWERPVFVAFGTGIGASGAPSALVSAGGFPFQFMGRARVTNEVCLLARARAMKFADHNARANGALTSFGDELDATLALQLASERFDLAPLLLRPRLPRDRAHALCWPRLRLGWR